MGSDVWAAAVGGLAGLATGAVSLLVAPWPSWGIEKRRTDRQRKYELLDSWRSGIAELGNNGHTAALQTDWYETLRVYASPDAIAQWEAPNTIYVTIPRVSRGDKYLFTGEADRIEQEWGLRLSGPSRSRLRLPRRIRPD